MDLLKIPHPMLFTKCKEVTVFGPELKVLLESMWRVMINHSGLGLSANQVNLPYRAFVMVGAENEKLFIVNPKILVKSKELANLKEGCLSSPGEFLVITDRSSTVQLLYQDETGIPRTGIFYGIHAVCCQHELAHLDGESYLQSKSLSRQVRRQLAKKWNLK